MLSIYANRNTAWIEIRLLTTDNGFIYIIIRVLCNSYRHANYKVDQVDLICDTNHEISSGYLVRITY